MPPSRTPDRRRTSYWMMRTSALVALALGLAATGCTSDHSAAPEGVGGIPAAALAQRGIYLGPPGKLPAGVPKCPNLAPATTLSAGGAVSSVPSPASEQQAVQGDPADGRATVAARSAVATALSNNGGFVGTVSAGNPVLVQLKDIYACIVATAWAVPVTGMAQLSCGPAPTNGAIAGLCQPRPNTAIMFVDAVTGKLISEAGFSGNSTSSAGGSA